MLIGFVIVGIMSGVLGAGYVVIAHDAGFLLALAAYSVLGMAGMTLSVAAKLLCLSRRVPQDAAEAPHIA